MENTAKVPVEGLKLVHRETTEDPPKDPAEFVRLHLTDIQAALGTVQLGYSIRSTFDREPNLMH